MTKQSSFYPLASRAACLGIVAAIAVGGCGTDDSGVGTADSAGVAGDTVPSATGAAEPTTEPSRAESTTDPGLEELPIDEVSGPTDLSLAFVAPAAARAGEVVVVGLRNDHVDDANARVEFFEGFGAFLAPQSLAEEGTVEVAGGTSIEIELVVEDGGYVELLGTSVPNPSFQFSVAFDVLG